MAANRRKKPYFRKTKHVEIKRYITASGAQSVSDSGRFYTINNISAAATELGRIGKQCTPFKVHLRFTIHPADETQLVRLMLFRSKKEPLTSVGQCFEAGIANMDDLHDDRNISLLWDHTVSSIKSEVAAASFEVEHRVVDVWIKVKRLTQDFNSTGAVEPIRNCLQVLCISDSAAVSHPEVDLNACVYYYDS